MKFESTIRICDVELLTGRDEPWLMHSPDMFVELESDRQFPCFVSYTNLLCAFESPGVTEDQFKEGPSYSEDMGAVYAKSKL